MTYCLAMRLDEGLVFLSDTRTNAGVDNISSYRKLHVFTPADDRVFVLQSAGSLGTTHQVLDRIRVDLESPDGTENLRTVDHLHEAALYVGRLNREVAAQHAQSLNAVGADGTATFILGGQVGVEPPELFLVHGEGNYIHVSEDRPFLQVGESKYGKFLLDFAVTAGVDLDTATKVALGSMMSTARANLSVGPPYDGAVYRNDSHRLEQFRVEADSSLLAELEEIWYLHLLGVIQALPSLAAPEETDAVDPT